MLESLTRLVEESAQQVIIQNKAIPDQFNNAAIREVTNQIITSLKGQVSHGNIQQVVTLFQHGNNKTIPSNPIVQTIISTVSSSLESKFGLAASTSQEVANSLIPSVITEMAKRANDPQDIDFDLQMMMRGMTGNYSLDISAMIGQQQPKGALGTIGNVFGKLFGK